MAKLPNANKAIIDEDKLRNYILSSTHPLGRFKATFFLKLGYSAENWQAFERDMRDLILSHDVTKVEHSRYGQKFIVEGTFPVSGDDPVQIVTVWVILKGHNIPRLVTAYPGGLR